MAESKEELKSLLMRMKEILMLGKTEAEGEGDNRGWDGWMAHWLNDVSMSKVWDMVKDRGTWSAAVHGVTKSWTWMTEQHR